VREGQIYLVMVNNGGIKKNIKGKCRDLHTLQDVGLMCALSGLYNTVFEIQNLKRIGRF